MSEQSEVFASLYPLLEELEQVDYLVPEIEKQEWVPKLTPSTYKEKQWSSPQEYNHEYSTPSRYSGYSGHGTPLIMSVASEIKLPSAGLLSLYSFTNNPLASGAPGEKPQFELGPLLEQFSVAVAAPLESPASAVETLEPEVVMPPEAPEAAPTPRPGLLRAALRAGASLLERLTPFKKDRVTKDRAEVVRLMAEQRYVRSAPRFADIVEDESRTTEYAFDYIASDGSPVRTEHEGLVELQGFLQRHAPSMERARAMLKDLTFIGQPEFEEAVLGLANYWKGLLDSDPKLQLCIFAPISGSHDTNSDEYLREQILAHFTDDELRSYRGRMVLDPKHITAKPEHTKVIMLEDWVISGGQMSNACMNMQYRLPNITYTPCVEVNLITASPLRVAKGLRVGTKYVPVRAYFQAHETKGPVGYPENKAYISGLHSTVDYDFECPMREMETPVPTLARIRSSYDRGKMEWPHVARFKKIMKVKE